MIKSVLQPDSNTWLLAKGEINVHCIVCTPLGVFATSSDPDEDRINCEGWHRTRLIQEYPLPCDPVILSGHYVNLKAFDRFYALLKRDRRVLRHHSYVLRTYPEYRIAEYEHAYAIVRSVQAEMATRAAIASVTRLGGIA